MLYSFCFCVVFPKVQESLSKKFRNFPHSPLLVKKKETLYFFYILSKHSAVASLKTQTSIEF